MAFGGNFGKLQ